MYLGEEEGGTADVFEPVEPDPPLLDTLLLELLLPPLVFDLLLDFSEEPDSLRALEEVCC